MRDFVTVNRPSSSDRPGGIARSLRERRPRFGLATRIVLSVVVFVMAAEITIYVPIIANFRDNWLRNRLSAAYTATLVLEAAPRAMVSDQLSRELLNSVGARIIVLNSHGTRRILAATTMPPQVDEFYDLRHSNFLQELASTYRTYTGAGNRVITV